MTYLPKVDQIVVLKDGEISEKGHMQQLISQKGAFAEFLEDYFQDTSSDSSKEINGEKFICYLVSPNFCCGRHIHTYYTTVLHSVDKQV